MQTMRHGCWIICLLFCTQGASAQPGRAIDADLVYGLLGLSDETALVVGPVSADEVDPLLPDGATLLGGIRNPLPSRGPSVRAVAVVDAAPEAARRAYEAATPAGFHVRPDRGSGTEEGFLPSERRDRSQLFLCADDIEAGAVVEFESRPFGGSYVRVWRFSDADMLGCREPDLAAEREAVRDAFLSNLPALPPMPGADVNPRGGGGGGSYRDRNAMLEGDVTLEAVSAHYREAMAGEGWTALGAIDGDDVVVSYWMHDGEQGPLAATLAVERTEPEAFRLRLAVMTAHEPERSR